MAMVGPGGGPTVWISLCGGALIDAVTITGVAGSTGPEGITGGRRRNAQPRPAAPAARAATSAASHPGDQEPAVCAVEAVAGGAGGAAGLAADDAAVLDGADEATGAALAAGAEDEGLGRDGAGAAGGGAIGVGGTTGGGVGAGGWTGTPSPNPAGGSGWAGRGGPFDTVSTIGAPAITGVRGRGCWTTTQPGGASDAIGETCDAARPCRARIAAAAASGMLVTPGIGVDFGRGGGKGRGRNGVGLALPCDGGRALTGPRITGIRRRGGAPDSVWLVGLSTKMAQAGEAAIRTARPSPTAARRRRFGGARSEAIMAFPTGRLRAAFARTPARLGGAGQGNKRPPFDRSRAILYTGPRVNQEGCHGHSERVKFPRRRRGR